MLNEQKLIKHLQNLQNAFQKESFEENDEIKLYTSKEYFQVISDTYKSLLNELNKEHSFLRD